VKAGVTFGDLSIDNFGIEGEDELADVLGSRTGFVVGGFVEVPLAATFSFAPEVLITQKGSKTEILDNSMAFELTQVQVPVLFKANFGPSRVRPFVAFGPAFGFNTSNKFKTDLLGEETEMDLGEDTKPVEVSVVVGGGVKFGQASVEARYDFGVNNLSSSEVGEIKTRTFSVLFGFGWGN